VQKETGRNLALGDTENFFHYIYREKVSRYWVYHDTCFASGVTEGGKSGGGGRGGVVGAVAPGCNAAGKGENKKLHQNI